ncbi:MAG: arylsulfatase [Verrucomicrobia bacterium]|nr:arylsulfatase [Verrucomicrobiota bacterium]
MKPLFALLALALALSSLRAAAAPNVLVVIADDLGWGDVPWHGGVARMPNLDRLRRDGVELDRFYANPSCTPTRAAFLTGRAALRLGLREQIGPNQDGLALTEHLASETFRAAGYATALLGKWHLGSTSAARLPNSRGFDHFYGFLGAAVTYSTHLAEANGRLDWQRNGTALNEAGYTTDLIATEAIGLLRARDPAKPFFHVLSFNAPHTPLEAPDSLKASYPTLTGEAQTYAAMLESLDTNVGRVLAELDAQKIAADTLVLFFSDNGGAGQAPASNAPLRLAKGNVYEGGIRTPALARWPGVIAAGTTSAQFIAAADLFPTLAAAVGVTPRNSLAFDGANLWSELRGGTVRADRAFTIVSLANTAHFEGNWKLIRLAQRDELYDIAADPSETNNQLAAQSAVATRLRTAMDAAIARLTGPETPVPVSGTARLVNLATRAQIGGAAGTPIAGFVISGSPSTGSGPAASKRVLTRAVGPGLAAFGVTGALADPSLTLVSGATTIATNDNWLAADATTFSSVGAFALTSGGRDAALVANLAPGAYTAVVGTGAASGLVLLETYDADATASSAALVNASTRAFVGTGESVLIPGFVISGSGTVKVLLRAAGPALASFGVTGTVADPQIALFSSTSTTALATNDNWSTAANAAAISAAAASAGAFAFPSGSRDAALLVELSAGNYTATVSGVGNTTGTALVEIYTVP